MGSQKPNPKPKAKAEARKERICRFERRRGFLCNQRDSKLVFLSVTGKDKDYRYMATSDLLNELSKDTFKADNDLEIKISNTVLQQLDDAAGDVSGFAVKWYLNAIQKNAHHLLRYLSTAVVVNKRRRNMLKELIKVIQQEQYTYKDPITQILECLYVNYDFEGAQQKLVECEKKRYFLSGTTIQEDFPKLAEDLISRRVLTFQHEEAIFCASKALQHQ